MLRKGNHKLFNRYLISFFSVVSISIALIIVIIFSIYANMMVHSARSSSIRQLEQVCDMTDLLYRQTRSICNLILQTASTNRCLATNEFDRLNEASAVIKLREIQTSNPGVRYVSIYNAKTNRFVSNSTVTSLSEDDIQYYYSILENEQDTCTLRLIGNNYPTQIIKSKYVYTFIFRIQSRTYDQPDLIIIDVDEDYFEQAISNLRATDGFQQVLIMNSKGSPFSNSIFSEERNSFTQTAYISFPFEKMPELVNTSGSFSQILKNNTRALITYAKTSSANFTILNVIPYSDIYAGLPQLALLTLLSGLLVLLVGLIVSYRTSARLSAPIETLYHDYVGKSSSERTDGNELDELSHAFSEMYTKTDKLERGLISSYSDSKKRSIQRLMHGEYTQILDYINVYQGYGIDLRSPYYCLIIVNSVSRENRLNLDDSRFFIYNYAQENITSEVINQFGSAVTYRNSKNMLAVLLPLSQNEYPSTLQSELYRIVSVMNEEFSMETTICIGNIVQSCENINMGYEATIIALEHSALRNHGKVFFADAVARELNLNQYHNKLHIKLAEHIRNEDLDACAQEFDLALSYMNNISFATAITYFNHVMMSLMDDFSAALTDPTSYTILIEKLNQIDRSLTNVYMLRRCCMDFVTTLTHHLSANRKGSVELIVKTAQEYIDKNFTNPDLSLRMLADMSGLSPAYFGKVFSAHTGLSFNDYLTQTRMNKAGQLLRETKLPINQISESIGILNTNYFYSVFKKRYNMTPLAFRRANGIPEESKK